MSRLNDVLSTITVDPTPLTIAVIAGGWDHERDISLRSGNRVAQVLRDCGHTVHILDVDSDMIPRLKEISPDVVWPLVHGGTGEDGSLQNILIALGLPYVGTHSDGCQLASFKPTSKAMVRTAGVLTPDSLTLPKTFFAQLGARTVLDVVCEHLQLPVVVKPFQGGSALGVSMANNEETLRTAMVECFSYAPDALIECMVDGTEVAVSVVDLGNGPIALDPVEIVTDGNYDFDARYNPGRSEYFTPARLDESTTAKVCEMAERVHRALGLGTFSRTDIIVDHDGTPWFIDLNVTPGMTETSLFPIAAAVTGKLPDLYNAMVHAPLAS
ncbi:D-alanine--D-alanine ligase family protein [Actinomyces vulturis]|uniref:D-alanine--D-alanine ligase family protein n=1 Tax=Actinomyces vulturis TaxID=1857645 RepID=UPI0008332069|nr:ATP-grasp domain-containing protein [Actinomyces vulturis]